MDKSNLKMVGIRIAHSEYNNELIKFMGKTTIDEIIDVLSQENFNEFDWISSLPSMLEKNGINFAMCDVNTIDTDIENPLIRLREEEEEYARNIEELYDIYVDIVQYQAKDTDVDINTQYVYVFSDEWKKSKCIIHTSGVQVDEVFWDETYISSLRIPKNSHPKFKMEAKISSQDERKCVPFYDRYIILKHINEIDNCDDLRDVAEEETKERIKRQMEAKFKKDNQQQQMPL